MRCQSMLQMDMARVDRSVRSGEPDGDGPPVGQMLPHRVQDRRQVQLSAVADAETAWSQFGSCQGG